MKRHAANIGTHEGSHVKTINNKQRANKKSTSKWPT